RAGHDGNRVGRAGGAQIGSFQGIDGNVDFWEAMGVFGLVFVAATDSFADVQHWRFVALALANDNLGAHRDGGHYVAHCFDGDLIGVLAITLTHSAGSGYGGGFDYSQEVQAELMLHHSLSHPVLRFYWPAPMREGPGNETDQRQQSIAET